MTKYTMNSGSYRHKITFQSQLFMNNEYGEKSPVWQDFITVLAGIYPVSGKDYISAMEINSEVTHKINLRYVPDITPNMRVKFSTPLGGERIFTIVAIMNFQEKDRELQLVCKEFL